ncbi:MAG: 4Fe-4S dicluster domain-containing protein [Acetobacteraceae bacterium]|nr:4Fe-4S dicluster domain-containing protein [Acetobacteraceae bacterium]
MGPGERVVEDWSSLRTTERARMTEACTRCGACFAACPMTAHAPATAGADAAATVAGVLGILAGGAGDAAARAWVMACGRTGSCNAACPHGVNPMLLMRLAKFEGQENGTLPKRGAADAMSRVKAFARLTLTEEEQRSWL